MPGTVDWSNLGYQGSPEYTQAQIQKQQGEAQLLQAQAQKQQMELAQEKQFQALLQGMAQGGNAPTGQGDIATQLSRLADSAMGAGLVGKASDLATKSAAIRLKNAEVVKNQSQTDNAQAQAALRRIDMASRLLVGVHDQQSWEQANTLYAMTTGQMSPFANQPYSPELVQKVQQAALGEKDRINAALKRRQIDIQAANVQSSIDFRRDRLGIMRENSDRAERRLAQGNKNGITPPNKAEARQAELLIKKDFPNLPDEESEQAGFSIASRARAIRRANPALDANQSLRQAYQESKVAGDFEVLDNGYKVFGHQITQPTTKFKEGRVFDLPQDVSKAVVGRVYNTPRGVFKKVNGGWAPVDAGQYTPPEGDDNIQDDNGEDE